MRNYDDENSSKFGVTPRSQGLYEASKMLQALSSMNLTSSGGRPSVMTITRLAALKGAATKWNGNTSLNVLKELWVRWHSTSLLIRIRRLRWWG